MKPPKAFYQETEIADVITFEGYDRNSPIFVSICDSEGMLDVTSAKFDDPHQVCWHGPNGDGWEEATNLLDAHNIAHKFIKMAQEGNLIEGDNKIK
jgi:hypothetical protein|tara:strand:+ start:276 stop:563 length:288 start_codon:yes stop_codon:yes gene_type:complete